MNFIDNSIVRDKNTTKKELEDFYKKQNDLRHKGTVEYFELRDAAINNSSDEEWNKIVKVIMGIAKS
jgi:hypothetical protein